MLIQTQRQREQILLRRDIHFLRKRCAAVRGNPEKQRLATMLNDLAIHLRKELEGLNHGSDRD